MPHQCTNCGRTFADGSKEMLSGCPECGGNKFQFRPSEATGGTQTEPTARSSTTVDRITTIGDRVDEPNNRTRWPDRTRSVDPSPASRSRSTEDESQVNARTEIVDTEDLPDAPVTSDDRPAVASSTQRDAGRPTPHGRRGRPPVEPPDEDAHPDIETLREELNSQFESIKIVEPGQYELNLMELYEREEYIIALKENGRYVIEVPDGWSDGDG